MSSSAGLGESLGLSDPPDVPILEKKRRAAMGGWENPSHVAISWCQNGGNKPERAKSIVLREKGVEGGPKKRESAEHDALAEAVVVSSQER